jgi:hypothetical protein
MQVLLITTLAVALAAVTYLRFEAPASRAWMPMALRAVAWASLGTLVLNPSCAGRADRRAPIALLDASLSMTSVTGGWPAAVDSARAHGEVRWFGDARPGPDSLPDRGRSELAPALGAVAATGRRVMVVTDGELDDATDVPADLLRASGILLLPRPPIRDYAVTQVTAPDRITGGDTLRVTAEIRLSGAGSPDTAAVELSLGGRMLSRRVVRVEPGASVPVAFAVGTRGIPAGTHFLRVGLAGGRDAQPRDDSRMAMIEIAATPGVVLLSNPGDWDARFLYRTLREIAELPVKGYVRLDRDRWRAMDDLKEVPTDAVRAAARGADLLVVRGGSAGLDADIRARGVLRWPEADGDGGGDWYLAPTDGSPLATAFFGVAIDSLPPTAAGGAPLATSAGDWVGATARLGRHGTARPVLVGRQEGRRRSITIGIEGLWRWEFRGGPSAQAYRAMMASVVSWLLASPDSGGAAARVVRPVVEQGMPLVFARTADSATALPVTLEGPDGSRTDTLRFGGDGLASVWLPPGTYRYRLGGRGGSGVAAVDTWSREWLDRPAGISARPLPAAGPGERRAARDLPWLYLLMLLALAGEWLARRRLGFR